MTTNIYDYFTTDHTLNTVQYDELNLRILPPKKSLYDCCISDLLTDLAALYEFNRNNWLNINCEDAAYTDALIFMISDALRNRL